MNSQDLTKNAKGVALQYGADLVGIVKVVDLPEHKESISRILPTPQSVMVIAAKHSLGAIRSSNIQVAQFDTINAYEQCSSAAHKASQYLARANLDVPPCLDFSRFSKLRPAGKRATPTTDASSRRRATRPFNEEVLPPQRERQRTVPLATGGSVHRQATSGSIGEDQNRDQPIGDLIRQNSSSNGHIT